MSQFLDWPCDSRLNVIAQILRGIKGSLKKGLVYIYNKGLTNIVRCLIADWAGDASDKRFTLNYCVLIGGNLISTIEGGEFDDPMSSKKIGYIALWLRILANVCG